MKGIIAIAFAALLASGCMTVVKESGDDGAWIRSEWGGSTVVEETIGSRRTTFTDGRIVEERDIVRSSATANGASENIANLVQGLVAPFKFLFGGG